MVCLDLYFEILSHFSWGSRIKKMVKTENKSEISNMVGPWFWTNFVIQFWTKLVKTGYSHLPLSSWLPRAEREWSRLFNGLIHLKASDSRGGRRSRFTKLTVTSQENSVVIHVIYWRNERKNGIIQYKYNAIAIWRNFSESAKASSIYRQ